MQIICWFHGLLWNKSSYYDSSFLISTIHLHAIFLINSLASGWGNISVNFLGTLSSKTTSEYHLEPNATNCIKIGSVSLPFSVSLHLTVIGDLFSSADSMKPSFSNCFRRIDNTLGVRPAIDSKILLKRSILRKPISLSIRMVHFLPRIPKLVLIGHATNRTWGMIASSWLLDFPSCLYVCCCNYTFDPLYTY